MQDKKRKAKTMQGRARPRNAMQGKNEMQGNTRQQKAAQYKTITKWWIRQRDERQRNSRQRNVRQGKRRQEGKKRQGNARLDKKIQYQMRRRRDKLSFRQLKTA